MIYTSYYNNISNLKHYVSIAGKTPATISEKFAYKKLAPKYVWWKDWYASEDRYSKQALAFFRERYYTTVLDTLDAKQVEKELKAFYPIASNIIMLCYETPREFCHRHLVAEWFNNNGILCKEIYKEI